MTVDSSSDPGLNLIVFLVYFSVLIKKLGVAIEFSSAAIV